MICTGCGARVSQLVAKYGQDKCPLPCPECDQIADPYVEWDGVLIFIDLVLHKPSCYRHLLFNRLLCGFETSQLLAKLWLSLFSFVMIFERRRGAVFLEIILMFLLLEIVFYPKQKTSTIQIALLSSAFPRLLRLIAHIFDYAGMVEECDWLVRIFVFTSLGEAVYAMMHFDHLPSNTNRPLSKYLSSYAVVAIGQSAAWGVCQLLANQN